MMFVAACWRAWGADSTREWARTELETWYGDGGADPRVFRKIGVCENSRGAELCRWASEGGVLCGSSVGLH
jgi:hypothetical protein